MLGNAFEILLKAKLYSIYWFIRAAHKPSERLKYYGYAEVEKKRLINLSVDRGLRLLCHHLVN
ncbi:hypothetical protein SAMN05428978_101110 [Nitrosomonas sp. Nm34]|nr:hypothetical protein SAMN05428978_101110 [Nitrosomonas sp. Nm34]